MSNKWNNVRQWSFWLNWHLWLPALFSWPLGTMFSYRFYFYVYLVYKFMPRLKWSRFHTFLHCDSVTASSMIIQLIIITYIGHVYALSRPDVLYYGNFIIICMCYTWYSSVHGSMGTVKLSIAQCSSMRGVFCTNTVYAEQPALKDNPIHHKTVVY